MRSQGFDVADDLVTRNDSLFAWGQIAFNHMKIGPTDSAAMNANTDLTVARNGCCKINQKQRGFHYVRLMFQYHGFHTNAASLGVFFRSGGKQPLCQSSNPAKSVVTV
jgi:hypothetical protein